MSLGWLAMQWNDTHPHRNPGDKRLRTGLECQDDVINAMNDAWMRSGNGTSGKEAGFILVGSEQTYKIVPLAYTNEQGKITFTLPSGAFAVVHVHPNSSAPAPSDNDINVANSHQLLMFTESIRGLWLYDPSDKAKLLMATGVLWQQPCDQ